MAATTEARRQPAHRSDGGKYRKHYAWIVSGGLIFAAAWAVWTFWFSAQIPP